MTTFATRTVLPLHGMIRDALTELRDARADGDPEHCVERCRGCKICSLQRHLDRLCDRLPRTHKIAWPPPDRIGR